MAVPPRQAILLFVVLLLSMELAARAEDWFRYGTDWLTPYREPAEMVVRDADGVHGQKNARFQKWAMNNLGFRGPDVDSAPPVGTLRVVTAGASETFGLYEPEGKEYPRQLEDSLLAPARWPRCPSPTRVEVLNAAMAGMTLPTVTQDVSLRLRRFAPAVVVYYPTPPQYLANERPIAARPDSEGTGVALATWQRGLHPRIADRLREQAKALMPGALKDYLRRRMIASAVAANPPGWRFESLPLDRLDAFEQDLRIFVGVTRSIGAEPVLATHGSAFPPGEEPDEELLHVWERFYPRATGTVILSFDSAAAVRTRLVASDSATALADVRASVPPEGFADDTHFNEHGAGVVAEVMADAIQGAVTETFCPAGPPLPPVSPGL